MADVNKVVLIGHMTRFDSEHDFGYTAGGKARLNLSIAVNEGYGEKKSVSYFDVVYWDKPAEAIKPYVGKGKQLCVVGRLKQDRWEKDGRTNTRVYVIAESIQLLGNSQDSQNSAKNWGTSAPQNDGAQSADFESGDFPEDIPF